MLHACSSSNCSVTSRMHLLVDLAPLPMHTCDPMTVCPPHATREVCSYVQRPKEVIDALTDFYYHHNAHAPRKCTHFIMIAACAHPGQCPQPPCVWLASNVYGCSVACVRLLHMCKLPVCCYELKLDRLCTTHSAQDLFKVGPSQSTRRRFMHL